MKEERGGNTAAQSVATCTYFLVNICTTSGHLLFLQIFIENRVSGQILSHQYTCVPLHRRLSPEKHPEFSFQSSSATTHVHVQ